MGKIKSIAARAFMTGSLLLCGRISRAATYYVSVTGNDSNPGTSALPFLTIQKGVNSAAAGDTVIVGNGTYADSTTNGILVTITSNGTAASPITLKAQTPGQAFLNGGNNAAEYGIQVNGSYWNIIGFDISEFWYIGIVGASGTNVLVQNNVIHNIGNITSSSSSGFNGIFLSGVSNWTVNANTIHDIGRLSGLASPNHDHGIYAGYQTTSNILITNNIFYNARYGWDIQIYPSGFSGTIANNTFYGPAGSEVPGSEYGAIVNWNSPNLGTTIVNNIFYNPNGGAVDSDGQGAGPCSVNNNIVYGNSNSSLSLMSTAVPGCTETGNQLNVNPLLVSPGAFNFNLAAGSPAIGAGLALASVPLDFNGASRAGRNDIGAFQYSGGAGAGPVITAVSASGVTQTGATINWTTSVAADSQVEYGLTSAYGATTTLNTTLTTAHAAALTGLTAGTIYHYAVLSHNSAGALATSPDATFTTAALVTGVGCVTSSAGSWQNVPLAAQAGTFTAAYDGTPAATDIDGVSGLSNGAASAFTSMAAAVRFNNTGMIDARNAGAYTAASAIPYVAGLTYHFTLVVNLPARTYSAYVAQGTNAQQTIGLNYAFRSEQSTVTTLNNLAMMADIGGFTDCNATVSASLPPTAISAVSAAGVGSSSATVAWTTNNPATSQVEYGPTTAYGSTTTINTSMTTSHSAALSGLTASTPYHYAVMSVDGAGRPVTSPDAAFTTAGTAVTGANCLTSSNSGWQNFPLAAQTGTFTAAFDGTPAVADIDGVSGLSNGAASAFTSMAAAVRFNNTGMIDARNAGAYAAASAIPYVAGMTYHFTLVVNLPARTYSAYVAQGTNAQQTIGLNYAFRSEQSSAAMLNNFAMMADIGGFTDCNEAVSASLAPTAVSAVSAAGVGSSSATIVWTTNNAASSQVQYGPTTAYGVTTTLNSTAATGHSVALGGLTAATLYHYQALSVDAAGNHAASPDETFTTAANTAPPVISAVSASGVTATGATIAWTTNEPATSQVAYGLTTAYGSLTALNSTLTTTHSAALSGLSAGTVYHYVAGSRDAAGNLAASPDATFTTVAGGPPPGCVATVGSAWQNVALTAQTGAFTASFAATPAMANEDAVMGLSNGAASAFTSQAATVRFNDTGTIDARNAGAYASASPIPYTAGLPYSFELVVNLKAHTYSAYVKQGSNAQQTIGLNYAFRTEQKAATLLNNLGIVDDTIGSVTVCNVVP